MRVAFGLKAHSGWAALVVIGKREGEYVAVDRRRLELVEEPWAKQPYHAAEGLTAAAARDLVTRGIKAAQRIAARELRAAVTRERTRDNDVVACAVLLGEPMPDWTIDDVLAVHFRMHKAEGVLFRDALARAADVCELPLVAIPEKTLDAHARKALGTTDGNVTKIAAALGKAMGPPWGKDQKQAAVAAVVAWGRV